MTSTSIFSMRGETRCICRGYAAATDYGPRASAAAGFRVSHRAGTSWIVEVAAVRWRVGSPAAFDLAARRGELIRNRLAATSAVEQD